MDIYEPTKFTLNKLFPYVVKGGIILIDNYNTVYGATKATDEFINLKLELSSNINWKFNYRRTLLTRSLINVVLPY